jgi:hypothetical protein
MLKYLLRECRIYNLFFSYGISWYRLLTGCFQWKKGSLVRVEQWAAINSILQLNKRTMSPQCHSNGNVCWQRMLRFCGCEISLMIKYYQQSTAFLACNSVETERAINYHNQNHCFNFPINVPFG